MSEQELSKEQIKNRKDASAEMVAMAKKRGLRITPTIIFPQYRVVPVEGQLAIQVLHKLEAVPAVTFVEITPEEKAGEKEEFYNEVKVEDKVIKEKK